MLSKTVGSFLAQYEPTDVPNQRSRPRSGPRYVTAADRRKSPQLFRRSNNFFLALHESKRSSRDLPLFSNNTEAEISRNKSLQTLQQQQQSQQQTQQQDEMKSPESTMVYFPPHYMSGGGGGGSLNKNYNSAQLRNRAIASGLNMTDSRFNRPPCRFRESELPPLSTSLGIHAKVDSTTFPMQPNTSAVSQQHLDREMPGDIDSPPRSIPDSEQDTESVRPSPAPPALKQQIPPMVPLASVPPPAAQVVILPPIKRSTTKKKIRVSVWDTFLEFLEPVELLKLSQVSRGLKVRMLQTLLVYQLIGEELHTSMGLCRAQLEAQTRTDEFLELINIFQLGVREKMHVQSRRRFHWLVFACFLLAILQAVLLSLWDAFALDLRLTFAPSLATLALVLVLVLVELVSYLRERRAMLSAVMENNKNPHNFPEFSGRRFVHPRLFSLPDFRHSSLRDYLLVALGVFFLALAIALKVYVARGLSFTAVLLLALMPLFLIKLLLFLANWVSLLRRRRPAHLAQYKAWVARKGMSKRVSYSEQEVEQVGSRVCCVNHMLAPGWLLLSSFFGLFILLAGLRLDGKVRVSWFLIFLPVWLIALPLFVLAVLKGLTIGEKGQRSRCEDLFWAILIPSKASRSLMQSAF